MGWGGRVGPWEVVCVGFVVVGTVSGLHFNDGTFKVVQFTDMHFEYDYPDQETTQVQQTVLDSELFGARVDLVVTSGDMLTGNDKWSADEETALWKQMVGPMMDRGLNWAITFGNHDDRGVMTRQELMTLDQSLQGSLSQIGPTDLPGVSNYWLPVYSDSGETDIAAVLYFLDTLDSGQCPNVSGNGCATYQQVEWYKNVSRTLNVDRTSPFFSLMFFHIPLDEYMALWNEEVCIGTKGERVCCPDLNTGLYDALVEMHDVQVASCGHDHLNDYCGAFSEHPWLQLCYGRKTGIGGWYPFEKPHGARVFHLTLDSQGNVGYSMWIRNEHGEQEVQLEHQPSDSIQHECYY
ncbi:metallophosphoesterase family protein [Pelomyxa schiedti]|nr:metallophosphoesterase family protein [Pelomyxa schiedti]